MGKHDQENEEDVARQAMSTEDNYQSELPKSSTSMTAAKAGEAEVVASRGEASQFRLPPKHFSSAHAEEKSEQLRSQAAAYNRSRGGKGTGSAAYRNMTEQADAYKLDAGNLEEANAAYNQLVPQSAFALDSVIRFKTIQAELGIDFSENDMWTVGAGDLSHHVEDRTPELTKGVSAGDIKTNTGRVSDAAKHFTAAQTGLYANLTEMQGVGIRRLIKKAEAERSEQTEKKETINKAMESASSITEFIGSKLDFGQDVAVGPKKTHEHEDIARTEGTFETAKSINEVGGMAISAVMHVLHDGELADIETRIATLTSELDAAGSTAALTEARHLAQKFQHARQEYSAALATYEHAIANQRTAYAKAGTTADKLHEKGGDLKHGKDKASQAMLFISAARETDVVLRTSLPSGEHAEEVLRRTLKGLEHRSRGYLVDDWQYGQEEGGGTPDRQQAMDAFGLTNKWLDATRTELKGFDQLEAVSSQMLEKDAKTKGEY